MYVKSSDQFVIQIGVPNIFYSSGASSCSIVDSVPS